MVFTFEQNDFKAFFTKLARLLAEMVLPCFVRWILYFCSSFVSSERILWLPKYKPCLQQPGWVPPHPAEGSLLLLTAGSSRHTAFNTWIRLIQHKHLHQQHLFLLTHHQAHTPLLYLCTCKRKVSLLPLVRSISFQNSLSWSPKSPPALAYLALL